MKFSQLEKGDLMIGTIFDFETTGLIKDFSTPSDDPSMPHIVQCAAKQINLKTWKTIQTVDLIVFPSGWTISQEVIDIHGIDNHTAAKFGFKEEFLADLLFRLMDSSDVIIAHNANFDKRIARCAFIRYLGREKADYIKGKFAKEKTICTMNKSIKAVGVGRYPKLSAAYEHFTGNKIHNAHNAMADVEACQTVLWHLIDQGIVSLEDIPCVKQSITNLELDKVDELF